jgi:hypothetical protein
MVKTTQPVRISSEDTDAAEPAVAAAPDGSVYVAWVEHRPGGEADVLLAHFDGEGKSVRPPIRANPRVGEATAWHGDPPTVGVAPDGTVYVGWTARAASEVQNSILYLSASRDDGHTFAAPVKVNDDPRPAFHGMHSLAVAQDGRIYVAWLDERNIVHPPNTRTNSGHKHIESNREVFIATSSDGGRTFSPNRRVAGDACPCCKTSLATGTDNRVYVSWRHVLPGEFRHIAVASSTDGGRTFSTPVIVSDDKWQIAGCPVSGAALAVGTDGTLSVLWYSAGDAGPPGLYWSESHDGGRTFPPRKSLAESYGHGTPVILRDARNDLMAVWESIAEGDSTRIVTAQLGENGHTATKALTGSSSELPAAARADNQIFVVYVSKTDKRRGIWLECAEILG